MKNYLQEYAAFIRLHQLDEFVSKELYYITQYDVPLMKFFSHLTPEQLRAVSLEGADKLLAGLEKGTAIEEARINLDNWRKDGLPGIPRNAVSLKDITLIYAIQKISLIELMETFTHELQVTRQLMLELERHYVDVQEMALEILEVIRNEDQQKSQESEEKFKDLFDHSNDLLQFITSEGNIIFTNNAWLETMGYTLEEVKGRSIFDFVKPEERAAYQEERNKLLSKTENNINIKTCYVTKAGKTITLEGFISAKLKNDTIEYTRGLLRDVTERTLQEQRIKAINDQLAEREENLRHLVQHAPDAIIVIDTSSLITLWNNRAEMVFGWKQEEVLHKELSEVIIPPHLREAHKQGMQRYLATGETKLLNNTVEVPALHKEGYEITIAITMSITRQGGKQNFIAFLRDITLQKKNELELENKRKQLEKTNHELEQYAWLTSHDLKEPVRKILTFSDALLKSKTATMDKADHRYLEKINGSAIRMNSLIEAVLQYSNVANESTLFEPTDLYATLLGVLDDLEILIQSTKAQVITERLPTVQAIPVQMRQLFQNIITNALKYRKPEEAPIITISCKKVLQGYRIQIKDNGIGFENVYSHKIFQVFQRLLTTREYEGTGIGLSLCKKIVETHNGSIYADSEPGVGSTFVILLPEDPQANPKA